MAKQRAQVSKNAHLLQAQKNISLIKAALIMGFIFFFGFAYLLAKFVNLY